MKRTKLQRRTPLRRSKSPAKRKKPKRDKLPSIKTVRNKADKLLTPIVRERHPYCLLRAAENCAGYTEVAHHHVLKSKCTALRYELENLIPLCHRCHALLHSHETYWSSVIVEIKGLGWWEKLKEKKETFVKADIHWYIEQYQRLRQLSL